MMITTGITTSMATLYLVARPDNEPDGAFPAAGVGDVGAALSLLELDAT